MKTFLVALAGGMMIAAGPAHAAPADPKSEAARPTALATPTPATERTRYCLIEQRTGTRIRSKTCKTRSEWLKEDFDPLAG